MRYHDITADDMKNGDGLRVTLWVSGCDHHCKNCQNPLTWDPDEGLEFDEKAMDEIFTYLSKDHISGITLSGGDPLFHSNRDVVTDICKQIKSKFADKTIWLYSGDSFEEIKTLDILKYVDVLVDGEYKDELRDVKLKWRGSANQRVIDVQKSLELNEVVLFCD